MANCRILPHLDDVGVSAGSVIAWRALRAAGVVRSASVMVPCPWYRMAVEDWHGEPDQDLGVHLTLTSEWSQYRWRPLIGPFPGLTDDEGYFHRRSEAVAASADASAVADEIAAQIEQALADGLRPTHLDAHMGTAYLKPFVGALLDASARYGIPVMMCTDFGPLAGSFGAGDGFQAYLSDVEQELARRGNPVLDRFLMGFCPDDVEIADHVAGLIADCDDGTHWLALHANAPDDTETFAPHMAAPRRKEFEFFGAPESRAVFDAHGASLCNFLDLN